MRPHGPYDGEVRKLLSEFGQQPGRPQNSIDSLGREARGGNSLDVFEIEGIHLAWRAVQQDEDHVLCGVPGRYPCSPSIHSPCGPIRQDRSRDTRAGQLEKPSPGPVRALEKVPSVVQP